MWGSKLKTWLCAIGFVLVIAAFVVGDSDLPGPLNRVRA